MYTFNQYYLFILFFFIPREISISAPLCPFACLSSCVGLQLCLRAPVLVIRPIPNFLKKQSLKLNNKEKKKQFTELDL